MIGIDAIQITSESLTWQTAIQRATKLLSDNHFVLPAYAENIKQIQEELGFYSVKDEEFALFHGNDSQLVQMNSMALLINEQPVMFGRSKPKSFLFSPVKIKKSKFQQLLHSLK